ncbi:MAG: hypothetical protein ACYS6K_16000 [Planctomycetota bacterium]|jgi:hypothetical protein
MKMPTAIVCIILRAITITSANPTIPNQLSLKIDIDRNYNVDIDDFVILTSHWLDFSG